MKAFRGPAFPLTRTRKNKYDGVGGFARNSSRIPPIAIPGVIAFLVVVAFVMDVGAAVGF